MHRLNDQFTAFIPFTLLLANLTMTNAQTEAKVNIATLPFLIPNVGLEVPLGD